MRSNLKSSKSYPHDLKEKVSEEEEEEQEDVVKAKEEKIEIDVKKQEVENCARKEDIKAVETPPLVAPKATEATSAPVAVETKKPESNQFINVSESF